MYYHYLWHQDFKKSPATIVVPSSNTDKENSDRYIANQKV